MYVYFLLGAQVGGNAVHNILQIAYATSHFETSVNHDDVIYDLYYFGYRTYTVEM